MLEIPSIALINTIKETYRMGKKAKESLDCSISAIIEKSDEYLGKVFVKEETVNELQKIILNYLLKLSKTAALDEDSREAVDNLFNTVNDIERIGDHAKNIAELSQIMIDGDLEFSEQGKNQLEEIYNYVISAYSSALEAFKNDDINLAYKVFRIEEKVDMMEKTCRASHMYRLNNNLCSIDNGVVFLDIITALERVSDHAVNIAKRVIAQKKHVVE